MISLTPNVQLTGSTLLPKAVDLRGPSIRLPALLDRPLANENLDILRLPGGSHSPRAKVGLASNPLPDEHSSMSVERPALSS